MNVTVCVPWDKGCDAHRASRRGALGRTLPKTKTKAKTNTKTKYLKGHLSLLL